MCYCDAVIDYNIAIINVSYAMNKCKIDVILDVKFAFQITYDKGEKIRKEWGS